MNLSELYGYIPFAAVIAGTLLLAWGQRSKITGFLSGFIPKLKPSGDMTPAKRFSTFYALRTWCEAAGYISAVIALDDEVLPAIVRIEGPAKNDATTTINSPARVVE